MRIIQSFMFFQDSNFQIAGWFKTDMSSNPWWFLARMKRRVGMIKNALKKHGRQTGRNFTDIWWHLYYEYFVICDLIRKHHVSLQLYSWIPSHNWLRATLFSENHCNWCKTTWKHPKTIHQFFHVFSVSVPGMQAPVARGAAMPGVPPPQRCHGQMDMDRMISWKIGGQHDLTWFIYSKYRTHYLTIHKWWDMGFWLCKKPWRMRF